MVVTKKENKDGNKPENNDKSKITRLNSLLKEMISAPKVTVTPTLELAKPIPKWGSLKDNIDHNTKMSEKKGQMESPKPKEENILKAAKEVAETLGGDTKQTESELLKKLLGSNGEDKSDAITSLSDIFKGMKIDTSKPQVKVTSRSEQVRKILGRNVGKQKPYQERRKTKSFEPLGKRVITKLDIIDLYGSEPLGIFTSHPNEYTEHVKNSTWELLTQREMKLLVTHPPSNYFQQMILWTEQGKLWKFPIDNEADLEDESNVSFAEHIFLDRHLDPWCPPKGPIRHFMELVCVGLSKNPYLTVNAKIEHIEWYKKYFEDKRQLLKDVGAALNEYEPNKEINAE